MRTIHKIVTVEKQIPETLTECNEVVMCYNCIYDLGVGKTEDCMHRLVLVDNEIQSR